MTLVAIRSALAALLEAEADGLGASTVVYGSMPQPVTIAAGDPYVRASMQLPIRRLVGAEAGRVVQQDGTFTAQWMFPVGYGATARSEAIEGTVAIYRQQTLAGGIHLTGDARSARVGRDESGRIRWDVTVPWRTVQHEPLLGDTAPRTSLQTTAAALTSARQLWHAEVEVASSGWGGLSTFYDDEPVWQTPPSLPFAGYWIDTVASASQESGSGTERVVGRALVQVHADRAGGDARILEVVDRIVAVHSRVNAGVTFDPVETLGQQISPAGTTQINLRIPLSFERLRL